MQMKRILVSCLVVATSVAIAHAGPCSSEIEKIEKLVANPNSGIAPTARQTVGAQLNHQPTPQSVARAEQKADAHYDEVLSKAKALDAANNSDCKKVVDDLKLLVGMQ
jgi:hypothetical protein